MYKENILLDSIIDRYYVSFKSQYEPYQLMTEIQKNVNMIFNTFVEISYIKQRIFTLLDYQEQLRRLCDIPKMDQRTPEWYEARKNLITASDFGQALGEGKFGTQKQFFQKKCGYEKDVFDSNIPALKWGVMYEQVACDAYAHKNNTKMYEFGLLLHPSVKWIGASPDAISELGIMLEIKCPWRRKITGEIPRQYYYQIQGQLDVCKLKECDYLECEFIQYDDQRDFEMHFSDNTNEKGIIIEYKRDENKYLYSPFEFCRNKEALVKWYQAEVAKNSGEIVNTNFWQLHTFSVVRVYKDDAFVRDKYPLLEQVWKKVVAYKADKDLYDREICAPAAPKPEKAPRIQMTIDTCVGGIITADANPGASNIKINTGGINGYAFLSDDDD